MITIIWQKLHVNWLLHLYMYIVHIGQLDFISHQINLMIWKNQFTVFYTQLLL